MGYQIDKSQIVDDVSRAMEACKNSNNPHNLAMYCQRKNNPTEKSRRESFG